MESKIFEAQANLIKALSHPIRLEIIHLLRHHVLTVSQIQSMLGVSQSIVSQHLNKLKIAQIIASRREGKEIYYAIMDQRILEACDAIHSFVSKDPLPTSIEPTVIDPVCGMDLTPRTAAFSTAYKGVRQYFCARGCYHKFTSNPGHFVR